MPLFSELFAKINKENANPVLTTKYGKVRGLNEDGVVSFKGIPYAAAPTKKNRFMPPQPLHPWDDILDCTRFRSSALQAREVEPAILHSEDCLYLNLWRPEADIGEALPVLVFIHGGGFSEGSPAKIIYSGNRFAQDGVIQVNITYRLNALGFMAFDELEHTGNCGLLDQIAALRWVRENIADFGGDPDRVTVCGESAGAFSISCLMLSPLAKGLFCRAILESGNILGQPILAPGATGNKAQALQLSRDYAEFLRAPRLADMQKLSARKIARGSAFSDDMTKPPLYNFWPVFDGETLPENPYKALTEGDIHAVDIMAGYNTDEGSLFIPLDCREEDYVGLVQRIFHKNAQKVLSRFPVDASHTPMDCAMMVIGMGLRFGGDVFADELSRQGRNVYYYNFNYSLPVLDVAGLGAMHALELIFVFDTVPEVLLRGIQERIDFKEDVHNRWYNFITSGDPNTGKPVGVPWPKYDWREKKILVLDEVSSVKKTPDSEDVAFFLDLLWK